MSRGDNNLLVGRESEPKTIKVDFTVKIVKNHWRLSSLKRLGKAIFTKLDYKKAFSPSEYKQFNDVKCLLGDEEAIDNILKDLLSEKSHRMNIDLFQEGKSRRQIL